MHSSLPGIVLAVVLSTGCHTWRPVTPVSPVQLDSLQGKPLRVHTRSGSSFDATAWSVRNDSIFVQQPVRDSVALSQVHQVEVKRPNGGHTAGLIISIALVLVAAAYLTVVIIVASGD